MNNELLLIKFTNGIFKLYQVQLQAGAEAISVSHIRTWHLCEQIGNKFQNDYTCEIGNLSRMNYKNKGFY